MYFNTNIKISEVTSNIPNTANYIKSVQNYGCIFFLFDIGIYVIAENSTFLLLKNIPFSVPPSMYNVYSIDS